MLTWIYEYPRFCVGDKYGLCILLSFGLEYIDDIEIEGERFFVHIREHETGWQVELDEAASRWAVNKDMVDNLIQELNNALKSNGDYDIHDFVVSHKADGSYFRCFVCKEEK